MHTADESAAFDPFITHTTPNPVSAARTNIWQAASEVRGIKVVALGGGHGLAASLRALKLLTNNITAIVTVADDGGSSGRLRKEFGVLPPGDLRMALAALCDDTEWGQTWRDVLQYRFCSQGELNQHSLGNLLITGLWDLLADPIAGLDWVGKLLNIQGRVLPMAAVPLEIEAIIENQVGQAEKIVGQGKIAKCALPIRQLCLSPADPPVHPEAVAAIEAAHWIIFGPGSWYTSVLPHLMVPELAQALCSAKAKKLLVLNLIADAETTEMTAADLIQSFQQFCPQLLLDAVLADRRSVQKVAELKTIVEKCGAQLFRRNLANPQLIATHDQFYLAAAYREIFGFFNSVR